MLSLVALSSATICVSVVVDLSSKAVILLSGGLDSLVALGYTKEKYGIEGNGYPCIIIEDEVNF